MVGKLPYYHCHSFTLKPNQFEIKETKRLHVLFSFNRAMENYAAIVLYCVLYINLLVLQKPRGLSTFMFPFNAKTDLEGNRYQFSLGKKNEV